MATTAEERDLFGKFAGNVRILRQEDVDRLRLGWNHRHDPHDVRRMLSIYPGRSVWIPDSREFALVAPWRHRLQIAAIQELSAIRSIEPLVEAVVDLSRQAETTLVLMTELDERRRPSFYDRIGFEPLEEVITYELERPSATPRLGAAPAGLSFVPVTIADVEGISDVIRIDHASFPWLWWNSRDEIQAYTVTPGVAIYLGFLGGQPIAYIGATSYPGWGHLDRIAVLPEYQGQGIGRHALAFALSLLARRGARRVGLSTQVDNRRSQRLYEAFGFHRSRVNDYRLYGTYLRSPSNED